MKYDQTKNTIDGIPLKDFDYVSLAFLDGFSSEDMQWIREHNTLPPAVFFATAHEEVEQGKTVKQIKLENDIPLVYDEAKDGTLIRADSGTITEVADAPVALQMVRGQPAKTIDNFLEIFRKDPHYDNIRFNELTNRAESYGYDVKKQIQCWRSWDDTADANSRHYCETRYGLYQKDKHNDAMRILWGERLCNPITDMLDALPEWDGMERCSQFFQTWLKTEDSEYIRAIGQTLFDSAVSRAYHAGCKYDLCIVLVGEEAGEGKSTLVSWLALDDEYAGEIKDMTRDIDKILEDISGKWIVEIGEYIMKDSLRVQDATKAFITRTQDTKRTPYDRYPQTLPRRCIFIATTNHREFLTDSTGGRRWLPVIVHSDGAELYASEQAVKDYIRKCYAEAVYRYKHGLCVLDLPTAIKDEAKRRQELAVAEDARAGIIEEYCRLAVTEKYSPFVCGIEVWCNALNYPKDKYTKKISREIREIMRKIPFLHEEEKLMSMPIYGKQRVFRIVLDDENETEKNGT